MQAQWYTVAVAIINNAARAEGVVTDFAYLENGIPNSAWDTLNEQMDAWAVAQTGLALV